MKHLIYAVDDELSIRELYACALQSAGFDYACFENGADLFTGISEATPSLILLDIMLEGIDGYEILKQLRRNPRTVNIPVIMISAKGEEISKVKGLNLGADDYLAKPFGVMELIARINAHLRKAAPVIKEQLKYKDIIIDDSIHEARLNDTPIVLTLKEYSLLSLLVKNAENLVKRETIFREVWGEDYMGETRTLDNHIGTLRKALANSGASITTIRGVGYILK